MKTLVVATRNLAKGGEMVTILKSLLPAWEIKTLNDYAEFPEPEETGTTYAENAVIKAEAARDALEGEASTELFFIADDAGLEIDALDGAPGVYSKRFGGEGMSFPEKIKLILSQLTDNRKARFVCCVAIASAGSETKILTAIKNGIIAREPRGERGFGYDPIFLLQEFSKTYAELTPEHKNSLSHRYLVLKDAANWLRSLEGERPREPQRAKRRHPAHQPHVVELGKPTIVLVTTCARGRQHLLAGPAQIEAIRNAWLDADTWKVGKYVVLPDHIHFFVSPAVPDHPPIGTWVRFFKRRATLRWPERQADIWQTDFWDTQMRSRKQYDEKWEYVRNNPVRHQLVENADDWPYQGEMNVLSW